MKGIFSQFSNRSYTMFKEKIKKFYTQIFLPFTAIFTALTLILGVFSYSVTSVPAIPVNNLLILALYSLILAFLNRIFYIKKLMVYIRMAIHFIFSSLALYLLLFLFTKDIISATENIRIVLVLLYIIIYFIVAIIYVLINESKRFKKPEEKKNKNKMQAPDEYQSIYNKK